MGQRFAIALVVAAMVAPGLVQAQQHEKLLPAKSQIYFHWDGIKAHRAAYEKTAVGKMMKGETGEFLRALLKYVGDQVQTVASLQGNQELAGAMRDEVIGTLDSIFEHGLVVGIELEKIEPFQMQAIIIFPGGGSETKSLLGLLNTMAKLDGNMQVKTIKQGKRTIQHLSEQGAHLAWWAEGKDAVLAIGTTEPAELVKRYKDKGGATITDLPLYKETKEFNEFKTWGRGYVDLPALGKVAAGAQKDIPKIIDALGLGGIKSITFYSGFDGPAERSVFFLNLNDGPRSGILKLASKKTFTLKDLPPMPPRLTSFSASNLDPAGLYDVSIDVAAAVLKVLPIPGAPDVKKAIADFEKGSNINIKEILDSLDSLNVSYYDGTEGILGMGQVSLLKVKDAAKLEAGLNKVFTALQNQFGGIVSTKVSNYQGAKLYTLVISDPTGKAMQSYVYTIHKDWMALSPGGPAIKGLILRLNGELPAWKADASLQKALAKFPKEFTGIEVSDPRPSLRTMLSVMPFVMAVANSAMSQLPFGQHTEFDLTLIPNAYESTRYLFPNVTINTDEGHRLRSETRASLMLPF